MWLLGRQDEAIEKNPEALDIAERQGLPFPIAYGHSLSAWFHQYRGDADEVLRHADASIQISREHDFGLLLPVGLMFREWALTALGRIAEGVTRLTAALEFYRSTGAQLDLPHLISLRADAHLRAGDVAKGLEAVEEALNVAAANDDRCWEPELYRLKGELLLARATKSQDSFAESAAEAAFREAIAVAQRQNSLSLELRATVSLARLEKVSGRPDVLSRPRLGNLAGRFPIRSHSADLDAARQLLIESHEQPKQPS